MKKRRKKMSSIVFMAFGEKVYNFITHLSNPAIFRDSTEMHERKKKKKSTPKRKFFARARKVDNKKMGSFMVADLAF